MNKPRTQYAAVELSSPYGDPFNTDTIPAEDAAAGTPSHKKLISRRDLLSFAIQIVCGVASVIVVGASSVARHVGQINQLVVLGILLTVMGKTFQGRLQGLLLSIEVRSGPRLQNLDAVVRSDALLSNTSLWMRIALFTVYLVPLALSAAYKQYVGGSISYITNDYGQLSFGPVGAPGVQGIGNGLSLMVNASLPFFMEPKLHQAYGFNTYSAENATMLFLDGPFPESVTHIQQGLGPNDQFEFEARVAGFVASSGDVTPAMRAYQNSSSFQNDHPTFNAHEVPLYPGEFSLLNENLNYTTLFVSVWGAQLDGQQKTFGEGLREIQVARKWCRASWTISKATANLKAANFTESTYIDQDVLTNNFMALAGFRYQINEFITQPVHSSLNNPHRIDLTVPAVGAAVWSRITALDGHREHKTLVQYPYNESMMAYQAQLESVRVSIPALKRQAGLFIVLAIFPVATFWVVAVRAFAFYCTAIDESFGLITILAGSSPINNNRLRGASLSGKAKKGIPLRFIVEEPSKDDSPYGRIIYEVGGPGQIGSIRKGQKYE
jgi:hypothetical protein